MTERILNIKCAVEKNIGGIARHVTSTAVIEIFDGDLVWEGVVETFDVAWNPKCQTLLRLHISRKRQLELRHGYRGWRGEFTGNGSQSLHHFQKAAMSPIGGPPCFVSYDQSVFYLKWGNENYLVLETGKSREARNGRELTIADILDWIYQRRSYDLLKNAGPTTKEEEENATRLPCPRSVVKLLFRKFARPKTPGIRVIPKRWLWRTRPIHAGETAPNFLKAEPKSLNF